MAIKQNILGSVDMRPHGCLIKLVRMFELSGIHCVHVIHQNKINLCIDVEKEVDFSQSAHR